MTFERENFQSQYFFPRLRDLESPIPKAEDRITRLCSDRKVGGEYKNLVKDSAGNIAEALKSW
jgi:hypothetical protein